MESRVLGDGRTGEHGLASWSQLALGAAHNFSGGGWNTGLCSMARR
jgi:hypothetical protein